jgi:hypothetical protein
MWQSQAVAFSTQQITLVAATATPLLVQGSTGTDFINIDGSVTDPLPVMFMISSGTVFWGGPNVSTSNGFPMIANTPVVINCYGSSEIPYVYSAGTPVVYVAVGRQ